MMMLNPAAQEKAPVQIDAVVGKRRLPSIEDRLLSPFLDTILRETLRYIPVSPLGQWYTTKQGIPTHMRSSPNDGSLKPNDVEHLAFGFGRRICPARHFSDGSQWSTVAKVLAVFNILKPMNEHGEEISIDPKFSGGVAIHPLPFKCRFVPRFAGMHIGKLEKLIGASTA